LHIRYLKRALYAICTTLVTCTALLAPLPAGAAEVSCVAWSGSNCSVGHIKGPIIAGDFDRVYELVRASGGKLSDFRLNSPGGSVIEAIQIGRLFRQRLVSVVAPVDERGTQSLVGDWFNAEMRLCQGSSCVCASACALIWLGGVSRVGNVGLHRVSTIDPSFRLLPPHEASALYRQWLTATKEYMIEMEAPSVVIDTMIQTSSADMVFVSHEKYGLEAPPSIAEWVKSSCGAVTVEDDQLWTQMGSAKRRGLLGLAEHEKFKALDQHVLAAQVCKGALLSSHRMKSPLQ
jgi:hypothetical protein